jgi:hypothetical protein
VEHPVPLVSAAMGLTAVRRAARAGAGLLMDSLSTPERCRELTDAYRAVGGSGACIAIRRVWIGPPPRGEVDRQVDRYRSYSSGAAQSRWGSDELITADDATDVAEHLTESLARAGADAVNLRVHVPGVSPAAARDQIARLGAGVVGPLRRALAT